MRVKRILIFLLLGGLLMSITACNENTSTKETSGESTTTPSGSVEIFNFPCAGTCQHEDTYINLDFEDNVVVVVIHEDFKMKDFSVDDFKIVNAKEIIWAMPDVPDAVAQNPVERPIINIILSQPGRQNVICAVQLLNTLEFIHAAEPQFILTPSPD